MPSDFDLVVIGAGPAGEKAAAQAAYIGKRVAVIERRPTPGGSLTSGVVASKTIREAAAYLTGFRRRDVYGVAPLPDPRAAIDAVRTRSDAVVHVIESRAADNLVRHGVEFIEGSAQLAGPGHVVVDLRAGGSRTLTTDVVLIATGSRPYHPPGLPFEHPNVLDGDEAALLDRAVPHVLVVGGGAVGCEYASILTALGSRVTLVDVGHRLISYLDEDLSVHLERVFAGQGVRLLRAPRDQIRIDGGNDGLRARIGTADELRPDKVIVAMGRVGNVEGLGLEAAGVATDERGRILVDATFQTTSAGVYAAGDVVGPPALASVSMEQARVAVCHAFALPFKTAVDAVPPLGVYTLPELASVGASERSARDAGVDCAIGRATFSGNVRATIAGDTEGFLKLVFRRDDRRLLGVHIFGDHAVDLVHHGQAVLHFGGSIDYFIDATYNVPTLTEAYKYAAYDGLARLSQRPTITSFA
ncbi:MAG TPA: Si-specific NAD(P)(+) transhydrogenase [Mycobacteriales bacterium]|nr:Si-specific NAD(P)(+) transhydrogenase [Mycobacteriales bacterium]